MNVHDMIAAVIGGYCGVDDEVADGAADAVLIALGCAKHPVAIVAPDQPVRRLAVAHAVLGREFYTLGPEVGESHE